MKFPFDQKLVSGLFFLFFIKSSDIIREEFPMDLAPSSAVSSTWHTWHTMGSKAFLFRIPVQKKSLEQRNLSNESFKKALVRIS